MDMSEVLKKLIYSIQILHYKEIDVLMVVFFRNAQEWQWHKRLYYVKTKDSSDKMLPQ